VWPQFMGGGIHDSLHATFARRKGAKRAGAELRVEALLGEQMPGRAVHLQAELLLGQAPLQALQLDCYDPSGGILTQPP
jgi:hypothetical protein